MHTKNKTKRNVLLFIIMTSILISLLPLKKSIVVNADDRSIPVRILCKYEVGRLLIQMQDSDYYYYLTRSKSAMSSSDNVVSNFSNKLLSIVGYDFNKVNKAILGREIRPSVVPEETTTDANSSAPKVSAFDRFGVAGLKWSSYQGEWKYNQVDACSSQGQVSPTTYGNFYEGRLEPQSTYNEVSTSRDPRTIQFNKGLFGNIGTAITDTIANGLFALAKFTVTLTIIFVGLSFTDITSLMGLSIDGTSGLTAAGIFTDIFNTIFSGFVVIAFVITALYMLYNALFKRQMRLALNTIIKSVIIFVIAIIMSTNPSYWVGIPNKIATYGQAIILNAMAGVYDDVDSDKNPSLCTTEVANIYEGVNLNSPDETQLLSEFEKINLNMRSIIGCKMWEELLFKPWVKGQFGTDYENLYSDKLGNINEDWVGKGSVPLGNGQTVDNWALFHLSTQTDAHAQIGENNFPTFVNDTSADWWRTMDALSNYDEEEISEVVGNDEHRNMVQVNSQPTPYWQSWIGNNSVERIGTAIIAIAFGIAGSIAPLAFSLSSAILGFGITLLMMTSPLFMLFGVWGGKGQGIFFGWLSALANTIIKKIGISVLLILSIVITLSTMNLIYTIGFVKSFILMLIVSFMLIKNKNKILGMMANIDFGGTFDPRTRANQLFDSTSRKSKNVGKIALATTAGAVTGAKTGMGIRKGADIAARSQLRNTMYQSKLGMHVIREIDINMKGERNIQRVCVMCHVQLGSEMTKEIAYRDDEDNFYCTPCADEIGMENLYEVEVGMEKKKDTKVTRDGKEIPIHVPERKVRTKPMNNSLSYMKHSDLIGQMDGKIIDNKYYWNNDSVKDSIKDNLLNLNRDIKLFKELQLEMGNVISPPELPQPLHEYIDIAMLNQAWSNRDLGNVENSYKEAWKLWYEDNAKLVENVTNEEIEEFKKEIENLKFEPNPVKASIKYKSRQNKVSNKNKQVSSNKYLYFHYEGKLMFNKYLEKENEED